MTNQLKRVNCSLFLDPVNSDADRYAVSIMQRWVEERKQLVENPSAGKALHENLHKHKDIYLSGLFLHLLSPALTRQLATVLSPSNVTMATLGQKLEMCGLVLPNKGQDAATSTARSADVEQELVQLRQTMMSQLAEVSDQVSATAQVQAETLTDAMAQLQQQAPASATAELDPAALEQALTSMKGHLVAELSEQIRKDMAAQLKAQSQAAEIAELKALLSAQNQLIRAMQHSGVAAPAVAATPAEPEMNLSEQIANVRKIKKKGLF
ncbi:hypothetical protein ABT56_08155 [Photobacterium aquae]|uniref:Uncharacterized protein n=1 Tax=Photobacterium aquae TaxID=1195763 RepID=A0A0J1H4E7_9GAMM|nr:hypothetical protein [Photobacterium aquae]KLV06594.1 hypothetical protein ABT56_08155 [Photobacterium aquae]